MGSGRRWAVDFTDNSTAPSRDAPDPPGFSHASIDQDDSALSRQKKDAEANWKARVLNLIKTVSKVDLLGPQLLFIALNSGGLALGVWKTGFIITPCPDPLVAILGMSLTIPLAMVADMVIHGCYFSAVYIFGCILVFAGFFIANLSDKLSGKAAEL